MSVVLSSAVAGVSDSEDRLHREQPDPALVSPRSPTLHRPALPDPLLREGQNPQEHILLFSCPAVMSTFVDSSWLESSQEKKCKHGERLRGYCGFTQSANVSFNSGRTQTASFLFLSSSSSRKTSLAYFVTYITLSQEKVLVSVVRVTDIEETCKPISVPMFI